MADTGTKKQGQSIHPCFPNLTKSILYEKTLLIPNRYYKNSSENS